MSIKNTFINLVNQVTGLLGLSHGGLNLDLTATGGTSRVLKQTTSGGAITVAQLAASDLSNGTTGTGAVVLANSPSLTTPTATTNSNAADNSTQIATNQFVQKAVDLSMATIPLSITGGTYSFNSLGSGAEVNYTAVAGVITSITVWIPFVGSGYKAGDIVTVASGNYDAIIVITGVAGGGYPTAGTILYGGTGYTSGTSVALPPTISVPFTFVLSGVLTSEADFFMTNGSYLLQSNQWIFCNNTTGAHAVVVAVSNSTNTGGSGGRTVTIPQGTNNSRSLFVQSDGSLNMDLAGVVAASDLLNGTTGTGAVVLATAPSLSASPSYPDNTTKIATTAYVTAAVSGSGGVATIASGQAALGTTLIASGAASAIQTIAASGVLATDNVAADFASDPSGVVGYEPSTSGMLTVIKFCTAGNVNFYQYNNTAAGITPGAININWRVVR